MVTFLYKGGHVVQEIVEPSVQVPVRQKNSAHREMLNEMTQIRVCVDDLHEGKEERS
jgi:hypothetical protein